MKWEEASRLSALPACPLPRFPAFPPPASHYFFAFAQASTVRTESAGT
jgi:hypothetical protein